MSDPPSRPHRGKAVVVWLLGWVVVVSPRLADILSRGVERVWPGFRES